MNIVRHALGRSKPLRLPAYAQPMSGRYAYTPAQIATVQNAFAARPDLFTLLHQATPAANPATN